ncbi:MAG: hypothetical protein HYY06_13175 [Deltaproteobacteria bacterium]|nr:hypothetical protein [Deltaproteobacteria bacterium]
MPQTFDDARLDLPSPVEADFVARQADGGILHVEMQGYRDVRFVARLFRYHLALVLRYPDRPVRTVAIWLVKPPSSQRTDCIEMSNVTVRVTTIVVPDLPASTLLSDPVLACFAPAAEPEGRTSRELCRLVARALRANGATWALRNMAAVAAAMHGRYHEMMEAMKAEELQPIVIEDLVRFGEDRGYERGMREGVERGMREGAAAAIVRAILAVMAQRGIAVDDALRSRIEAESDEARPREWLLALVTGDTIDL